MITSSKFYKKTNPSKKWIIGIGIISFGFLVTIPFFRERFQFAEPSLEGALVIFASGFVGLIWYELVKLTYRRKWLG